MINFICCLFLDTNLIVPRAEMLRGLGTLLMVCSGTFGNEEMDSAMSARMLT